MISATRNVKTAVRSSQTKVYADACAALTVIAQMNLAHVNVILMMNQFTKNLMTTNSIGEMSMLATIVDDNQAAFKPLSSHRVNIITPKKLFCDLLGQDAMSFFMICFINSIPFTPDFIEILRGSGAIPHLGVNTSVECYTGIYTPDVQISSNYRRGKR